MKTRTRPIYTFVSAHPFLMLFLWIGFTALPSLGDAGAILQTTSLILGILVALVTLVSKIKDLLDNDDKLAKIVLEDPHTELSDKSKERLREIIDE